MASKLTIEQPASVDTNTAFTISGNWLPTGVGQTPTAPTMEFSIDGGTPAAFPGSPTLPAAPSAEPYSFTDAAGIATAGEHTIKITDGFGASVSTKIVITVPTAVPLITVVDTDGATLALQDGDQITYHTASTGQVFLNGSVLTNSTGSSAMGVNAVPDNVIWAKDSGSGNWYTNSVGAGDTWFIASPQPSTQSPPSGLTQPEIDAIMSAINAQQVAEVPNGECFSGTCYTQEALVGDILIAQAPDTQAFGTQGTYTDGNGNVWGLVAGVTDPKYDTPPAWWWGGITLNGGVVYAASGVDQYGGYFIALRYRTSDSSVWVQEAKQGGWWNLTVAQANPGDFASFARPGLGGDPGH